MNGKKVGIDPKTHRTSIVSFLTGEVCKKTGWSAHSTVENFDENKHEVFILTLNQGNIIKVVYDSRDISIICYVRDSGAYEVLEKLIGMYFREGVVELLPV